MFITTETGERILYEPERSQLLDDILYVLRHCCNWQRDDILASVARICAWNQFSLENIEISLQMNRCGGWRQITVKHRRCSWQRKIGYSPI